MTRPVQPTKILQLLVFLHAYIMSACFKMCAAGSIIDDLLVCLVMSACLIPSIAIQASSNFVK